MNANAEATTRASKPPYPPEWRGTWFRPGEPGGMPSPEAKQGAWAVIIQAVDNRVREEALTGDAGEEQTAA